MDLDNREQMNPNVLPYCGMQTHSTICCIQFSIESLSEAQFFPSSLNMYDSLQSDYLYTNRQFIWPSLTQMQQNNISVCHMQITSREGILFGFLGNKITSKKKQQKVFILFYPSQFLFTTNKIKQNKQCPQIFFRHISQVCQFYFLVLGQTHLLSNDVKAANLKIT